MKQVVTPLFEERLGRLVEDWKIHGEFALEEIGNNPWISRLRYLDHLYFEGIGTHSSLGVLWYTFPMDSRFS